MSTTISAPTIKTPTISTSTVHPQAYREACARLASPVYVVAGADADGPYGATASSVCSLSLEPLLLLACLDKRSSTLARLLAGGVFAVNALPEQQIRLATRFATRSEFGEKFREVSHRLVGGAPVLDDALVWFVCEVHASYDGGDHTIVVGAVTALDHRIGQPLVCQDRRYRSLA